MLLPYNVDRVTKTQPIATWVLIAVNIFVFILSVSISNLARPLDKQEGQAAIVALTQNDPEWQQIVSLTQGNADFNQMATAQLGDGYLQQLQQRRAMIIASKGILTLDGYQQFWQIEHAYDTVVLEPHWSFLNLFAYHVAGTSPIARFFSMFSAMFVHASIDHIAGNLLFLWVFGRATEEFLGRKFYLWIYFLSGIGATLLDHIMTMVFSPQTAGIPNMGASGAIAGVLGLFAVRFYRTHVRVFAMRWYAGFAFIIVTGIMSSILAIFVPNRVAASTLALIAVGAAFFFAGREVFWRVRRWASWQVIGVWVVVLNLLPAVWQLFSHDIGGVAYWAHIGGFGFGALYAFIIGGVDDGKTEYQIEDAHTALHTVGSDEALRRAGQILQSDGENAKAHEIAALGYDQRNALDASIPHYQKALELYWKNGERNDALRLYGQALESHPQLPLRPALLLNLAGTYAQNGMWTQALAIWVRLIEEFPQSSEAEIAFLRSAQAWMRQYHDPAEAARQLELFLSLYPNSSWRDQAENALKAARAAGG